MSVTIKPKGNNNKKDFFNINMFTLLNVYEFVHMTRFI